MKRNQSARPENFRVNPKVAVPKLGISDTSKTQNLKNRLIERGLGTNPLPSVKKPRVATSSTHRLQTVQTVQTLQTATESKLTLLPSTSRVSITGFTSLGALRPSSAIKNSKVAPPLTLRTANQPSRPCTARTNKTTLTLVHSFRNESSKIDDERVANLIDKLTNRPSTALREPAFTPIPKPTESYEQIDTYIEESRLDQFIRSIKDKTSEPNQFVYLLREPVGHANDYDVVPAEVARTQENGEYFTLSAAGLSTFISGSPVEFIKFADFLTERKQFFNLKHVAFFQQFRVWKIVKMWERNVNRYRRSKRRKKLDEKLYSADPSYFKVLVSHRGMCIDMEKMKFIDIPGHLDQVTLKEFVERQKSKIAEVRTMIQETSKNLRINVRQGIIGIMNQLREEIVMDIAEKKNYGKLNLQMFPQVRKICSLYEKMGFPENMSYDQRSDLRKECSRFVRFTYLADFLALESLQNIYQSSVRELLLKIYEQLNRNSDDAASDKSVLVQAEHKKRNRVPLFKIELVLNYVAIDSSLKIPLKTEFVPRKSPPEDFHPNIHLSFDNENLVVNSFTVKDIEKVWLKLAPDKETFVYTLEDLVAEGLDALRTMQRWSRHPDIEDYVSALEEWDDKVADKWIVAEDIMLDVISWLEDSSYYKGIHQKLDKLVKKAFKDCKNHFSSFNYSLSAYWKNLEIRFDLLEKENLLQKVDSFDWTFSMFRSQKALIEKAPKIMDSGLFRIDCMNVKQFLIQNSKDSLKKSQEILVRIIRKKVEYCRSWASKSARLLGNKVFTVEEFVNQKVWLQEVNDQISDIKRTLDLLGYLYNLGLRSEIGLGTEDTDQYTLTMSIMTMLNGYIINIESTNAKNMAIYKKKLKAIVPEFLSEVSLLNLRVEEDKFLKIESNSELVIKELTEMKSKCLQFSETSRNLSKFQEVLGENIHVFAEVQSVTEQVDIREKLWKGWVEYEKIYTRIQYSPVKQIDHYSSTVQAEEFYKIVRRSESVLQNSTVLESLKAKVQDVMELMPIVSALRAPFLDSHWKMLRELLTEQFDLNDGLTLNSMKKFKIKEFAEEIQAISVQASQEFELKSQLKAIVELWDEMEVPLQQFKEKDVYILGDIEEFTMNLEDSLAKLSLISGNRYVTPLRDEVVIWRSHLNTVQDVLDEWTTLQKTWMYFSAIFSSQDIKRRLASESQTYETVDKFYRHFMKRVNLNNNAIKIMVIEGKLLEQLRKFNTSLEVVQKNLSQYLEDKRAIFPRFYFISDDELLKVLAQAGNPISLQPLISKCFENIHRLEFGEDLKAADVLSMVSSENETVSFGGRVLKARGNVEDWLGNVQWAMVDTLMKAFKYCKEDSDRMQFKNWVLSAAPCQAIATVASVNWCIETDVALGSIHDSPNQFKEWVSTCYKNLHFLVDLVKSPVHELKRKLLVAMITTAVHHRDILISLQEQEIETNSDFAWQKQLRYYWDGETCIIKQINFACAYAYEYLGCTSRLVVTPLTEKCWITITSAINVKLGACPSGPAGTGKTESTKDLAKALGQLCIVFNCSEQITYKMTGRLLAGLIQQGAWSCLDEFNRIDIEVLSVIAQQLQSIKNAQINMQKDFIFEGRKIPVKTGFGVFVTMNPGYAGRTELPDNLKVLFRPVSMMIPDYSMIAEIMLMAEGFQEASRLSKKIVQLYKLANEQLSSQHHYDFGLRALKSVLIAAGEIRRKLEEVNEEKILIQSMNESNLPKLVGKDVLLFRALVKDLFPGVLIVQNINEALLQDIKSELQSKALQSPESFIKKIFELGETMLVRYGTMILGPSMSGKSTLIRTLATCKNCSLSVLNPKSITIGELYGDMNHLTQDWKDGLASSIFREITNCPNPELRWVVFDGPVDSLWIESMNTVLDDNMMLCLPNGERIKLKPTMRILFEVSDLSKASPATVSRCGMVYIPSDNLTWQMLQTSWLNAIEPKETKDVLAGLFASVVPLLFKTYDRETDMIPSSEIHKTRCLLNLLTILLKSKHKTKHIHSIFAFAVIWSLGVLLDSSKHERVIFI
jgi:dynein heavy chain